MLLKQFYPGCLARASYRIVDEATRTAVVVDSQCDIEQYLHETTPYGWHLDYVFLTHFHADCLAGPIELRDRVGVTICLGAQAGFACTPFAHGDRLEFGHVRLEILETPGHTPEAISILVYDLQQDPTQPHAGLMGDTLFIGDVGCPDLMASDTYIDGSLHLPLSQLQRQLSIVPRDRTVVLQCAGGYRCAIAASILANHGMNGDGGFSWWSCRLGGRGTGPHDDDVIERDAVAPGCTRACCGSHIMDFPTPRVGLCLTHARCDSAVDTRIVREIV